VAAPDQSPARLNQPRPTAQPGPSTPSGLPKIRDVPIWAMASHVLLGRSEIASPVDIPGEFVSSIGTPEQRRRSQRALRGNPRVSRRGCSHRHINYVGTDEAGLTATSTRRWRPRNQLDVQSFETRATLRSPILINIDGAGDHRFEADQSPPPISPSELRQRKIV
jgi:hypothetical protein